jgi:PTH1 family peptidyl-tRNA hydrolase
MKLIVGLGNPGRIYTDSRHNIGFSLVKSLSKSYGILIGKDKLVFSLSGKGKIEGQNIILSMPLTYMNLSGIAISALLRKYKIELDNLLVVCDDLDLEFGRIKLRPAGSSGGHNGLKSIIDSLKTQDFSRLRIGIGRPRKDIDSSRYVLSPFAKEERHMLKGVIKEATDCCQVWVTKGVTESMNIFNRRSKINN